MKVSAMAVSVLALGAALAGAPAAKAGLMLDMTSDSGQGFFCTTSGCTVGYDFTLTSAVTIKAMGLYDVNADGLTSATRSRCGTQATTCSPASSSTTAPSSLRRPTRRTAGCLRISPTWS